MKINFRGKGNSKEINLLPLEDKWIGTRSLPRYIKEKYDLDLKGLHNLLVNGDSKYKSLCHICGSPRSFRSLSEGYNKCNRSCSATARQIELSAQGRNNFQSKSDEWKQKKSEEASSRISSGNHPFINKSDRFKKSTSERQKSLTENGIHNFNPISHSKSKCSQFINEGSPTDLCTLYLIRINEKYKFGITSKSISVRYQTNDFILLKELKLPRELIAKLELKIKLELELYSEFFESTDLLAKVEQYFIP